MQREGLRVLPLAPRPGSHTDYSAQMVFYFQPTCSFQSPAATTLPVSAAPCVKIASPPPQQPVRTPSRLRTGCQRSPPRRDTRQHRVYLPKSSGGGAASQLGEAIAPGHGRSGRHTGAQPRAPSPAFRGTRHTGGGETRANPAPQTPAFRTQTRGRSRARHRLHARTASPGIPGSASATGSGLWKPPARRDARPHSGDRKSGTSPRAPGRFTCSHGAAASPPSSRLEAALQGAHPASPGTGGHHRSRSTPQGALTRSAGRAAPPPAVTATLAPCPEPAPDAI